jgi:hypothetical protein
MRKLIRKVFHEIPESSNTTDLSEHLTRQDPADALYQRMFERDIYLHISEISVAMIGVCLTGVSILNLDDGDNVNNTYIDDLLAINSSVFLASYLLSYWLVRVTTKTNKNVNRLGSITNFVFLVGMIIMVVLCISIVLQGDFSQNASSNE